MRSEGPRDGEGMGGPRILRSWRFPAGGKARPLRMVLLLLGSVGTATILSMALGTVPIPFPDVLSFLLQRIVDPGALGSSCPVPVVVEGQVVPCTILAAILWENRVPEILLALLVGGALAISGGTMQGIFRNPLGDPYLLGISSGAAVGAAAFFVAGYGLQYALVALPLFAFLGAMGSAAVILLASHSGRSTVETLLLTGVALASFFGAVISLVITLRPLSSIPLTFWTLGYLSNATWGEVALAFGGILAGSLFLALHGRDLNLLQLGDETARGLGCDVERVRRRLLVLSALVTAVAVAFSGAIGFVGLISPHIIRRLRGPDYRYLLPLSTLFGGLFLLLADDLAVTILGGGGELPPGVITSFVGAPFFLWILYRRRRRLG